jgi:hypothetical protein
MQMFWGFLQYVWWFFDDQASISLAILTPKCVLGLVRECAVRFSGRIGRRAPSGLSVNTGELAATQHL